MQRRLRVKLDTILGIIIRSGGNISQSDISNQCKKFFGYNSEMAHRVRMSKMLIMLEKEDVIVRTVKKTGVGRISTNFWFINKYRLKDCENVVHRISEKISEA